MNADPPPATSAKPVFTSAKLYINGLSDVKVPVLKEKTEMLGILLGLVARSLL
jgi:hypothetical protein